MGEWGLRAAPAEKIERDLLYYARRFEGHRRQPAVSIPAPALLHPHVPRAHLAPRTYPLPQIDAAFTKPRFNLFRRI
jgi:hypothetical protein